MKKQNTRLILFFCTFLIIGFAFVSAYAASVSIAVPERAQEHSEWCWAGSSKAVLDYYGTSITQCTIANWAWSRSDCCGNTDFNWSHSCNQPNYMYGTSGSLQGILSHWGVNSTARSNVLSWSEAQSEINAKRPYVMRFGWTNGGGHFLDGYGYDTTSPGYVNYMDPWPGHGYTKALYSSTVSASDHTWTHTLQITTNNTAAKVTSLYPVYNAMPGSSSRLWAYINNTGGSTLPSNALVWYYVRGPGIDKFVGSASVSGLTSGSSQWRYIDWAIPSTASAGSYYYWAIVYLGNTTAISGWSSAQAFTVGSYSAQVTSLWSVYNAKAGATSTLWADIKNTGSATLPSNALVWYYVRGPGIDKFVGSASASGITSGSIQWKYMNWAIPSTITPGSYNYWAIVYLGNTTAISGWSSAKAFTISGS